MLTVGGVYDNLGLETAWKKYQTILVSDGGGQIAAQEEPKGDWARHGLRINDVIDNQVRSLRKRQLIASFEAKAPMARTGAYWGIRASIAEYGVPSLKCPFEKTSVLASIPTRLRRLDDTQQERLINWGYAMCDAAMRRWVESNLATPSDFPYPASKVG